MPRSLYIRDTPWICCEVIQQQETKASAKESRRQKRKDSDDGRSPCRVTRRRRLWGCWSNWETQIKSKSVARHFAALQDLEFMRFTLNSAVYWCYIFCTDLLVQLSFPVTAAAAPVYAQWCSSGRGACSRTARTLAGNRGYSWGYQ